jgi:hypothetical protein
MKRLPWIGIGLALLAQTVFVSPLDAQPVGLTPISNTPALSRHSLTHEQTPGSASVLYDTSLLLSNLAHLTSTGDAAITSSASDKPELGYVPPSLAVTTPTIDPYYSTSLGRLNLGSKTVSPAVHSSVAIPTAAPMLSAQFSSTSTHWRLGSRFQLPTTQTPVIQLPGKEQTGSSGAVADVSTSLGRGTLVLASGSFPIVGVPEPSAYLLIGAILVLAAYWTLRRRETVEGSAQPADTVDLSTMTLGDTLTPESAH